MPRKPKLRETTQEVLVVADPEDNPTGYRVSVFCKRENVRDRDQIVLEAPKLLGEDRV
jgi:hypothetical protein